MALHTISIGSGSNITLNKLWMCCLLALLVMAASFNLSAAASHRRRPPSVTYYIHAIDGNISTAVIAQPVDSVATGTFGQAKIFSYKATLQPDINSTQVGSIRGLEVYDSIDPSLPSILVLNTVTYDDGVYAGTFSLHGQGNINLTTYDITVVGGTAHFAGGRGYATITNLRTPGSDHVFQHVLHFL